MNDTLYSSLKDIVLPVVTLVFGWFAKVFRDKELIYNGQIQSLKHFKEDVREMKAGLECGIRLDNFEDFEEHDVIEVFEAIQVAAQL